MELLEKGAAVTVCGVYGIDHRPRTWRTEPRPFSVFSYRLSGHTVFRTEEGEITVPAGDLIYIPAGISYRQTCEGDSIIAVHFTAEGISDTEMVRFSDLPAEPFLRILDAWAEGSADGRYRAQSLFFALLSDLSRERTGAGDARVARAIRFMHRSLASPTLTVAEIAAAAGTSEVFLRRLMHRELGTSPLRYLNGLRIAAAKELLAGGYDSIESIAARCGFADPKYFASAFRAATGMSASEYRRSYEI